MSLNPLVQFDETSLTAAEFDPQDKVLPNSPIESNDVNVIASRALRRTAYLNSIKANLAGATFTGLVNFNAGAKVASGQDLDLDGAAIIGDVGFAALGKVWLAGRKRLWRRRGILADANHTIDVADGDRFNLPNAPGTPRTITLETSPVAPTEGETITFFWNPGSFGTGSASYTFVRQDATVIAEFVGAAGAAETGAVYAEFEYALISTGPDVYAWRLGKHSGTSNEYVPPVPGPESWDSYGVIPGAGA